MDLAINLTEKDIKLSIKRKGGLTIDSESFSYYHDLEQKLIIYLDKLLKRNNIDVHSLKGYRILGNLGTETTSHKIAEAFVRGLEF